jgi:hypothetical protein
MTKQEAERQLTALRAQQTEATAQFHRLDGAIQILSQLLPDFPDEPEAPHGDESEAEAESTNVIPFPGGEGAG